MRLELKDRKSSKFWEADLTGKVLHVRYGKIGTTGQKIQKTFPSPDAAAREHAKLIAAKTKKGYAEVARDAKAVAATKRAYAAPRTVKARGPEAKLLGELHAASTSLTIIAVDAADAAAWRGSTKKAGDGAFPVGREKGVRVHISSRTDWSGVWKAHGRYLAIALVDAEVTNKKDRSRVLGLRIAQWLPRVFPKVVGKLVIHSGVLALLLPHRDGTFSPADLEKARGGAVVVDKTGERILIPVIRGKYDVERYPLQPERERGEHKDDDGVYGNVVMVSYRDRLPAKYR